MPTFEEKVAAAIRYQLDVQTSYWQYRAKSAETEYKYLVGTIQTLYLLTLDDHPDDKPDDHPDGPARPDQDVELEAKKLTDEEYDTPDTDSVDNTTTTDSDEEEEDADREIYGTVDNPLDGYLNNKQNVVNAMGRMGLV